MKFKKFTFITSLLFFSVLIFKTNTVKSRASQPPTGGLAGESQTCNSCHSGSASVDTSQFVLSMNIDSALLSDPSSVVTTATQYVPGTTYYVSLAMTATTGAKYGFQFVPTTGGAMAGSITKVNTANTATITSGGKTYIGHKNASSNKVWIFKWTAPATTTNVTFYYAGLVANGNGGDSGDKTYKSTSTITAYIAPNGINDLKNTVNNLTVYPTMAQSTFTVKMDVPSAQKMLITIYDIAGNKVKEIYNQTTAAGNFEKEFSVEGLSAGTYFINISGENCKGVSKIIKY